MHHKQPAATQMACSNESGAEISSESDESSLLEEIFSWPSKQRKRLKKESFLLSGIPFSAFCKDYQTLSAT